MTEPGTDFTSSSDSSNAPASPVAIGYAQNVDESSGDVWRRWMAFAVGVWLLLIGASFLPIVKEMVVLLRTATGSGTPVPSLDWWQIFMWAASFVTIASFFAGGVGLLVFARRRVAVRNIALALLAINATNALLTLATASYMPLATGYTREDLVWLIVDSALQKVRTALPVLFLLLACVRPDSTAWRWVFRLGWWFAIIALLSIAAEAIRFERYMERDRPFASSDKRWTLFHYQPELAVQAFAAIAVLATLLHRATLLRRAALMGCAGLLVVIGCDVYPMVRAGLGWGWGIFAYRWGQVLIHAGPTLIPIVVIALCWKRLPPRVDSARTDVSDV